MKNITNKALILLLVTVLSSTVLVNAEYSETGEVKAPTTTTMKQAMVEKVNITNTTTVEKEQYKDAMEERKENRETFMETQKEKKEEAKLNRETFKENKDDVKDIFSTISDETKDELKKLRDEHKDATEELREKLKDNELTLEEREELKTELELINKDFNEKMMELVGENEKASAYLAARKELKEKNEALRQEAKIAREQYREGRDKQVKAQKEFYLNKLASVIPKVTNKKLESISVLAQKMVDKIEKNTKISDEKKEELIAKVVSLIEILDEELEDREASSEESDVDAALAD